MNSTKDTIKLTAQNLFAEKGIDGVAVRDIVKTAGLKNQGSLHYYFGTKEDLVRELIVDGAILIDERRNAQLDELVLKGGPYNIREITDILVFPATGLTSAPPFEGSYVRFICLVQLSHPGLFMSALDNQWNSGYQRCLSYIRNLLPAMPDVILNQRFIFTGAMLGSVLSLREKVIVNSLKGVQKWKANDTLKHLSQIIATAIEAPIEDSIFTDGASSSKRDRSVKNMPGPVGLNYI